DVGGTGLSQHVNGSDTCGTSTGDDNLQAGQVAAEQLQGIAQCREDDHGSTVLIIVHNRDIEALNETTFDLKAAWCGDIFQVDSAEGWCQASDRINEFINVLGIEHDGDGLQASKGAKQLRFAFHHGQGRLWADIAQSQNGGAIRDDRDGIAHASVRAGYFWVCGNCFTNFGYTWRVRQGQIAHIAQRAGGSNREFAAFVRVEDFFVGEV